MEKLFYLQPEIFFNTDLANKIKLTKTEWKSNLVRPVSLNDTYFLEGNLSAKNVFYFIKCALEFFGFEDELFIKYADEE